MKKAVFSALVADVKVGKTKNVIKFDAETINREELANLTDLVNSNVRVTVEYMPVVDDEDEEEGMEYSVNGRGEVAVSPGQTNIDDYIPQDELPFEQDPEEEKDELPDFA